MHDIRVSAPRPVGSRTSYRVGLPSRDDSWSLPIDHNPTQWHSKTHLKRSSQTWPFLLNTDSEGRDIKTRYGTCVHTREDEVHTPITTFELRWHRAVARSQGWISVFIPFPSRYRSNALSTATASKPLMISSVRADFPVLKPPRNLFPEALCYFWMHRRDTKHKAAFVPCWFGAYPSSVEATLRSTKSD
jgi:hypothetical protein